MISYLEGKIKNKGNGFVILLVNSIGYKIFINKTFYEQLDVATECEFYTFQNVREDALDLYGFKSLEELELFELLISISGIGPKGALGVLAIATVADVKETIARGDSSLLVKVSGIGKKTAERVVLELKDKISYIQRDNSVGGASNNIGSDEIDALMALGYSVIQARDALRDVSVDIKDSGERIREALKKLG